MPRTGGHALPGLFLTDIRTVGSLVIIKETQTIYVDNLVDANNIHTDKKIMRTENSLRTIMSLYRRVVKPPF